MNKLTAGHFYKIDKWADKCEFIGIDKGDYTCDLCNKNHYTVRGLPSLYWFKVCEDNYLKFGTACIKKLIITEVKDDEN